ncbi:hypothetical protein TNCT_134241 [Trichonephila clavata]|uniref:Uncharacterized protein n=1 Tax=Trichonephila clavata TaxID=2740835 RepID=A0A8X6IPP8_TRICU|nr:hypothetical protein TNCT_134241 [Trichonephila clavata]
MYSQLHLFEYLAQRPRMRINLHGKAAPAVLLPQGFVMAEVSWSERDVGSQLRAKPSLSKDIKVKSSGASP